MEFLNSVEITGVVGKINTQNVSDHKVANLSVVTEESFRDANGCAIIETTWFNVVAWQTDKMPDLDTIERGSRVRIQGRLRANRYNDVNSGSHIFYVVIASSVVIVEPKLVCPKC